MSKLSDDIQRALTRAEELESLADRSSAATSCREEAAWLRRLADAAARPSNDLGIFELFASDRSRTCNIPDCPQCAWAQEQRRLHGEAT